MNPLEDKDIKLELSNENRWVGNNIPFSQKITEDKINK